MDFIFMLTRRDRTVEDCLSVMTEIEPLALGHIGFKDVGVEPAVLRVLRDEIRVRGGLSYLEVVATDARAALRSAEMAVELGVERLLGGTQVAETLRILRGSGIAYYPFPGLPFGHPTQLAGDADLIEAQTAEFVAMGCAGVDLLAYRATEAEPLALVAAARRGLGTHGTLICAGGVDSPMRIAALRAAGCDAFTVGSAVFESGFVPGGGLAAQLAAIQSATASELREH